ncbi:MAG: class I SAM-dependent rRNA methyltransferase [Planctomycetota bacterium]
MGRVIVKRGHAKPLWMGHPWVFRESIARVEEEPDDGDLVTVQDEGDRVVGCGFLSASSRIAVRILSRDERVDAGKGFFAERLARAARLRRETLGLPVFTDGYRVVHSEGDLLPGLVVDHFAGHLVVQFSTVGMHRRREAILDALEEVLAPKAIYEQPDRKAAELEGLPRAGGLLRGADPPAPPSILENGVCFRIGLGRGQKTGFYADQRDNRELVGRLVRDRTVLDLHAYTGGFGLYAAVNGAAEVLGVDTSGPALALAVENALLNNGRQVRFQRADCRETLDALHASGRAFDVVVSDPPRFARSRAAVPRALRSYRNLHLRALRVVSAGGLLAASSCSGVVTEEDFEETLRSAAHDLGRGLQILHRGGQSPDHPVLGACPEGRYLKFVLACVT